MAKSSQTSFVAMATVASDASTRNAQVFIIVRCLHTLFRMGGEVLCSWADGTSDEKCEAADEARSWSYQYAK
jgi:hypothetical protein